MGTCKLTIAKQQRTGSCSVEDSASLETEFRQEQPWLPTWTQNTEQLREGSVFRLVDPP